MTSQAEAIEARVDALLDELAGASPDARAVGEALLAAAVQLHTPAIERMLAALQHQVGVDAVRTVAADPVVSGVLVLHGLHPVDVRTRVEQGLERVRPTVDAHAGSVELLDIDDGGIVHLRLGGTCDGCPSSSATLHHLIEGALFDAAPELAGVVVDEGDATHSAVESLATRPSNGHGPVPVAMPTRKRTRSDRVDATAGDELPGDRAPSAEALCQLCLARIGPEHDHAVDVEARTLACVCSACALLLGRDGSSQGRFRMAPRRVLVEPAFTFDELLWDRLGIPVSTAFFFHNSALDRVVALYPSPAGATESLLALDAWADIRAASRVAADMRPDVEAVLVRRGGTGDGTRDECFLVPIDRCYELVGLLRTTWKGFDGGADVRRALDEFFAGLRSVAEPPGEVVDA